jgi:hypothetical protein
MGAYALINPRWAARLVRLRDDPERLGGFAEFRATYGGLFLATHLVALHSLLTANLIPNEGPFVWPVNPATDVCAAMWVGTAVGRGLSMLADKTATRFNCISLAFELGLGLLIAAPRLLSRATF